MSTVKMLTSSLHYYESVASNDGSDERARELETAAASIRSVLAKIETEIKGESSRNLLFPVLIRSSVSE